MSILSADANVQRTSPLISIWFSPLQTIEYIAAERPRHLLWPLATLGGAASVASILMGYDPGSEIVGWRALLACAIGGALFAIINLYILAVFTGWIGRTLGGAASNDEVRAVFAWGALPNILGLVIILATAAVWPVLASDAQQGWFSSVAELVSVTCGVWTLVVTLLMLSRVERFGFGRSIVSYAAGVLVLPVWLALMVRTFLFQPFSVPAWSMAPTLLPGDDILAEKYPYGYSRYSLPFSPPLFSGRILGSQPARGDVIVFSSRDSNYVKRVVGLPGDRIQMKQGELFINDRSVKRERLPDISGLDACGNESKSARRWRETLEGGVSYETIDCIDMGSYDNTNTYTVPAGHLFVLGDNRDNSTDSRVLSAMGYVPVENVIGRTGMIYFSRQVDGREGDNGINYDRIGRFVK
jgi:signal peptidase I